MRGLPSSLLRLDRLGFPLAAKIGSAEGKGEKAEKGAIGVEWKVRKEFSMTSLKKPLRALRLSERLSHPLRAH